MLTLINYLCPLTCTQSQITNKISGEELRERFDKVLKLASLDTLKTFTEEHGLEGNRVFFQSCDKWGVSPFQRIILGSGSSPEKQERECEILEYLLSQGADMNAHTQKKSYIYPVHSAVRRNKKKLCDFLCRHEVNEKARDFSGRTALDYIQEKHPSIQSIEEFAEMKNV
jgi:hypothetical protein